MNKNNIKKRVSTLCLATTMLSNCAVSAFAENNIIESEENISFEEVIPCEHDYYVSKEGYDATCDSTGLTDELTCSICGEKVNQELIDSLGHFYIETNKVLPACTKKGYTGDLICDKCGDVIEGIETPSTGHNYMLVNKIDATCINEGYTGDSICIYGDSVIEGKVIPILPHDLHKITVEPTCTNPGYEIGSCINCDYTYDTRFEPLDHDFHFNRKLIEVEATMEEEGWYVDEYFCSRCTASHYDYNVIPMLENTDIEDDNTMIKYVATIGILGGTAIILYAILKKKNNVLKRK